MHKRQVVLSWGLGLALGLGSVIAEARPKHKAPPPTEDKADEARAGTEAAPPESEYKPVAGPQKIDLGHEVVMELPDGFLYLDAAQAKKLMEKNGNLRNDDLLGVVGKDGASWLVTIRYTEDGYVKDDEAAKLDADEMFKQIHDGTEEANKERQERGFKPLHVLGWSEPPRYEVQRHHLVWGMRAKTEDDPVESINFNTRILGRKGFVALNLIDGVETIEASKPAAATLLAATSYAPGARYEDFNRKTDKVAEYGLAALVLGGAGLGALKLVKIGLLAKFGGKLIALLIAFKKAIVLLFMGAFAFIKRLFGGGKKAVSTTPVETAPPPGPVVPPGGAASDGEQHPTEGDPRGQGGG